MPKNILIFSDGTGQGGGLNVDERRSNVYKLFRATRSAPDTCISPDKQIAFYDPGLGSSRDNEHIRFGTWRKVYNFFAQAMGLGITRNIIDCYAFLIQHYQAGDRVYLYGFSRGAYTARCVGGVMAYCGIPTLENGSPIKRDSKSTRRIAEEAVVKVYQHGMGHKENDGRFAKQRRELAAKFRKKYASEAVISGEEKGWSNVVPYFIGVWDTVAALGAKWPYIIGLGLLTVAVTWSFFAVTFLVFKAFGFVFAQTDNAYLEWSGGFTLATAFFTVAIYLMTHLRWATGLSDPWWKTFHRRAWKLKFYDIYLNPRVRYAKHAMSIDENRKDFERVPWDDSESRLQKSKDWFEQIWFAGVHSDIGGSYPETESRLSDIALEWMVDRSTIAKHPILVDPHYLRIYPDPGGVQHDERKLGGVLWKPGLRRVPNDAPLDPSVIERFKLAAVVHYDEELPYRPEALRTHDAVKAFYEE